MSDNARLNLVTAALFIVMFAAGSAILVGCNMLADGAALNVATQIVKSGN